MVSIITKGTKPRRPQCEELAVASVLSVSSVVVLLGCAERQS